MITSAEFDALKARCNHIIQDELSLAGFKKDKDGDFAFRYERRTFVLVFHSEDPAFIWLRLPCFFWYPGREAGLQERVDRAINQVNFNTKMVKLARNLSPDKDGDYGVSASVSMVLTGLDAIDADSFERYLQILRVGEADFMQLISEDEPNLPKPVQPQSAAVGVH